jgi:hypothetical protein
MSDKNNISKKKLMSKSDFFRIKSLFEKWWNWLAYLTFSYIFIFFSWNNIKSNLESIGRGFIILDNKSAENISTWSIVSFFVFVIVRGLMFCADGLVTSWLKSPFSQICYSVNKSGIDDRQADKIITLMTEVNEHFKETFKKFGILTVSKDLMDFYYLEFFYNAKEKKNRTQSFNNSESFRARFFKKHFLDTLASMSLLVPIIFAVFRIIKVKALIEEIEVSEDEN